MYSKARLDEVLLDPGYAESLADILYEIGKQMLEQRQHELAVKWLERAYNGLLSQELENLSIDAGELRISVIQCLGQSNTNSKHLFN